MKFSWFLLKKIPKLYDFSQSQASKGEWAFWQMVLEQVHIHMQNQKIVVFHEK